MFLFKCINYLTASKERRSEKFYLDKAAQLLDESFYENKNIRQRCIAFETERKNDIEKLMHMRKILTNLNSPNFIYRRKNSKDTIISVTSMCLLMLFDNETLDYYILKGNINGFFDSTMEFFIVDNKLKSKKKKIKSDPGSILCIHKKEDVTVDPYKPHCRYFLNSYDFKTKEANPLDYYIDISLKNFNTVNNLKMVHIALFWTYSL
jgi:hypothetical protein